MASSDGLQQAAEPDALAALPDFYQFGPHKIRSSQVFYETELSLALVNLKPVVPGHVLVIPRRVAPRFADLAHAELADLWKAAQHVGQLVERHFEADSLTFVIQDGPNAGQTVPHVHVHILPRRPHDFVPNDKVYDALDSSDQRQEAAPPPAAAVDADDARRPRSEAEMAAEAAVLRSLLHPRAA